MLNSIKRLWARLRAQPPERDPHRDFGEESGAHPAAQPPEELHKGRRRLKETFTSHWDLDYMPREEMERLMGNQQDDRNGESGRR